MVVDICKCILKSYSFVFHDSNNENRSYLLP